MELSTAVRLIEKGVAKEGVQTWADLGSGKGLFTKALASMLHGGTIHAFDKDAAALQAINLATPAIHLEMHQQDFSEPLLLKNLDGILMANAIHFVKAKPALLKQLRSYLKPNGRIILVEYDTNTSNPWVPFPISFITLKELVAANGFTSAVRLAEVPSIYNNSNIYSALIL